MTRKEAIQVCKDVQSMYWCLSDNVKDAMEMAIKALSQPEQNHLTDKASEETDDKYKYVAEKLNKVEEKIQQLEKDVNRLKNIHTTEIEPVYPYNISRNQTTTGLAYAGPEFNKGVSFNA